MKNIIVLLTLFVLLFSCNSSQKGKVGKGGVNGEIVPEKTAKWFPERPKGMVAIPSGSFVLGQSDFDFTFSPVKAPLRTVTVSSFYMDETEVTNSNYRFFVNYVKDSVARTMLAEAVGDATSVDSRTPKGTSIQDYSYITKEQVNKRSAGVNAYQEFLETQGDNPDAKKINWNVPLHWSTSDYPDVEYAEVMEDLYYTPEERFEGERSIDVRKLKYAYSYEDKIAAVKSRGRGRDYIINEEVPVYPDTTVWVRDFNYSHNEPMFEQYFWHKAFNEYPVVGVTHKQALAYCAFRTKFKNDFNKSQKKNKKEKIFKFRLPTETEWEYAARGDLQDAPYPWGGPYLIDDRGCYMANFKPKRGDYIENDKGYLYTSKVKTFHKNGYGLYDMAGNVSEWTVSPFDNSAYLISSTINPYLGNKMEDEQKVIRGGSWKDIGYMLMVSQRDSEHQDSARSYIGFRCVQTIPESADLKLRRKDRLK
ncbi:MAG: gliding motility lipoprotein GldK [Flavobacteriales bacterium]|nr:gliding motility lipoprotein GldK [Flavobacteriales bacterium]